MVCRGASGQPGRRGQDTGYPGLPSKANVGYPCTYLGEGVTACDLGFGLDGGGKDQGPGRLWPSS